MLKPLSKFLGLRNLDRAERQPFGALELADDVLVTAAGGLDTRPGMVKATELAGITDGYGHNSLAYAVMIANGRCLSVDAELQTTLLGTGFDEGVFAWAQAAERIVFAGRTQGGFVINGMQLWPLRLPHPMPPSGGGDGPYRVAVVLRHPASGLESGASEVIFAAEGDAVLTDPLDGYEIDFYISAADDDTLRYAFTGVSGYVTEGQGEPLDPAQVGARPMPLNVTALEFHQGRLYCATYLKDNDLGAVWASEPFGYHWFHTDADAFPVPGEVLGMQSTDAGLVIGTTGAVCLLDNEGTYRLLADYGVVRGRPFGSDREGNAVVWTLRGQAKLNQFGNLFDGKLRVDPGISASNSIADMHGDRYAVAITQVGGDVFNPYP